LDNRVRRYAETLAREGYEVDAIALQHEREAQKVEVIDGVRVFRIQRRVKDEKTKLAYLGKLLLFFLRSTLLLARQQIKHHYDLIHIHSVPDFEVFAAWYPKLTGSKLILDIHDIVPEFYASKFNVSSGSLVFKLLVIVERMSVRFVDHVITSNHIWEKRLQQRSGTPSKVTAILNFPDARFFQRRGRNRKDDKFIVLYPGSFQFHQGIDLAIRAFALIQGDVPKAEFHIYGSGEQEEFLRSLIGQLGVRDRVLLKRPCPFDRISSVMENADLGIVPKRSNNFGNEAFSTKTLEFMTMGVPLIVPDTAIDRYYFDDSIVKFFHANDERSLADAMRLLICNAELRVTLTQNASEFVKKYRWQENQAVYLDIVGSLLNSGNSHSMRAERVNG
jgi:glycosyltransferase involved in cell wall biosynthesis